MEVFKSMVGEVQAKYVTKDRPKVKISCSDDSVEELRKTIDPEQIEHREFFTVLFLNRSNNTLGWSQISSGGISGTACDPKIIFQLALLANASAIILCHNHPSGNIYPSKADDDITKKLVEVGKALELTVLDHIILTKDNYYSYANEGRI